MTLTCPGCSARYTISAERLNGRRVKVRCKRCGESFAVDASQPSGEVYARQSENRRGRDADLFAGIATAGAEGSEASEAASATGDVSATTETRATPPATPTATPLTGERNESSVLFSLATLARQAPAPPASETPTLTESSALIDIRALVSATSKGNASAPRADDIVNLGGGGPFAPLFASPLAPPVTFAPADEEAARRGNGPIVVGAMALAVVAMVGVAAAFVGVRSTSPGAPAVKAAAASTVSAPVEVASVAGASPSNALSLAASEAPPASAPQVDAVTRVKTGASSNGAPPARSAAHANDAHPVAAQTPTASASAPSTPRGAAKCCPGESEIACQMRLSAGATCSVEAPGSTASSSPPFDRLAAARALGINMASCRRGEGPTGTGHVKVTFQPSGSVSAVDVDPPYAGTATGACVAQRYRGASVPPFAGGPLSVGKSFAIE